MIGLIGGSGFEKFEGFKRIKELQRETPFGMASSGLSEVEIEGQRVLFISRHGQNHESLPTEVNYRANIFALKREGAKAIVSFSAVGSLQKDLKPGDLVIPNQYIDRTKGTRPHTFLGDGIVGHVSLAKPICHFMEENLKILTNSVDWDTHYGKTYVCIEGPYFSTQAESKSYRFMGADIIGMTHFPEFALAREAGLPYLPCCFVTDYDCWDDSIPQVTLAEVLQVMRTNNGKAFRIAKEVLKLGKSFYEGSSNYNQGLRTGLMTPRELIPHQAWSWFDVLIDT